MKEIDKFYLSKAEPERSCLLAMRAIILDLDQDISESWKYSMPFFCLRKKMFCYLWIERDSGRPYLGIVEGRKINHPQLVRGTRARMKILFIDPKKDLPVQTMTSILRKALILVPR